MARVQGQGRYGKVEKESDTSGTENHYRQLDSARNAHRLPKSQDTSNRNLTAMQHNHSSDV